MMPASIVIPTRLRPSYLEVALASIAPQAAAADAEVLVVDDAGASREARELSERFGARYEPHGAPLGLNVARNTGVARSSGALVVFVDDDVRASAGWLAALLEAARTHPDVDVFAGPIHAVLEGRAPRSCGRERAPITTLELGSRDTDARYAWGANMAIRRSALERIGAFDESLEHGGDEQEWQDRLHALAASSGGHARVLYVANAPVEHRRAGRDARLRSLARAQYVRGRAARRFDARQRRAPSLRRELLTLAGSAGHVLRRRCPLGLTSVAHSAGRVREAARERAGRVPAPATATDARDEDFLSGTSGAVGGADRVLREARDVAVDAWQLASGRRLQIALGARREPPRRSVLAIGIVREQHRALFERAQRELASSRHELELRTGPPGELGKFENLNRLLGAAGSEERSRAERADWLLVVDDDVELPHAFLDRFLFLCERFSLQLAQPAHRLNSHAAWPQTRRLARSFVHETRFVEIGPVTAFSHETFATLLPFPQLRMGWGLDAHWGALAGEHGWRCGVTDAVAIGHRAAPAADAYSREMAIAEARAFLAERAYVPADEAKRTLATHRRLAGRR
jgi:GT2 family glycosyltransferase